MSCMLRAGGKDFDLDDFVENTSLIIDSCWRKGDRKFPISQKNQSTHDSSGVRIVVSDADMSKLPQQLTDAAEYLRRNLAAVKVLCVFPGVEGAELDFGAEITPPGWSSFEFPPELLSLCGDTGISLRLSVYPVDGESDA
jgi:hypothetical protein